MGSFSIWHWLVVLLIVVLVFGQDLGGAVKGFKDGMKEGGTPPAAEEAPKVEAAKADPAKATTIDVDAKPKA